MWVPAYLTGVVAVGFVAACCLLAHEGAQGVRGASVVGATLLLGLSAIGVLVSLLLLLAGEKISEGSGIWTRGQGQQFLAALVGFGVLAVAVSSVRRRSYLRAAVLIVVAGLLFALWGLLVEGGWSDRGPLALVAI